MALKANYQFLFVGRDDNSFLENYSFDQFQDFGDESGQIFINLEIQNNLVDAEEIGEIVFENMRKAFFETPGKNGYDRFEMSLKAINSALYQFRSAKDSGYIGNLNLVVAAVVGDTLFLSQCGDAEAYLVRKRFLSIVSEGLGAESGEQEDVFTNIASGKIEAGDFILFASSRLLRYIGKTDLAKALSQNDVAAALDEVKDVISTEMLGRIGLTGIQFSQPVVEDFLEIQAEGGSHQSEAKLESKGKSSFSEKFSLVGKFVTAINNYRSAPRRRVAQGTGILSKIKGVLQSITDFVGKFVSNLVNRGSSKDKVLASLVVVIFVLIVGIFIASGNNSKRQELERFGELLDSADAKVAEAITRGSYAKDASKVILDKAYEEVVDVANSGYHRDRARALLLKIEETRNSLDNVIMVESPKVLVDLEPGSSGLLPIGMVSLTKRFFVFDEDSLFEVLSDKLGDAVVVDAKEKAVVSGGFDERNSLLFVTQNNGVIEYRDGNLSFMDTVDGKFKDAVALDDWSTRIYLLDAKGNQIWRYNFRASRQDFDKVEAYIADLNGVDLTKAVDFSIDGGIYVLSSDGGIQRFYGGQKSSGFVIKNPPLNSFDGAKAIFTTENLNKLFVLDEKSKKVFVFDKDRDVNTGALTYNAQYQIVTEEKLVDLYVDGDAKKMFILTEKSILEVPYN